MIKNKSLLIIIGLIILCLIAGCFIVLKHSNRVSMMFDMEGYILANREEAKVDEVGNAQHYFNAKTPFKTTYSNQISFKDINNDNTTVVQENFVHYSDGSISALSKGVVMNLDDFENDYINCYNVAENAVLQKQQDAYVAVNMENKISFKNILWKISNNKYMAVSDTIKVYFSENNSKEFKDYVELSYSDSGVLTIVNQQGTWQTVSPDSRIEFTNGTIINLNNKTIEHNGQPKMSLAQMVIDCDDNIEITSVIEKVVPQKKVKVPKFNVKVTNGKNGEQGEAGEAGVDGKAGKDGEAGEAGGSGGSGGTGQTVGGGSGTGTSSGSGGTGESEKQETIILPKFETEKWQPSASGIHTTISVKDEGNNININQEIVLSIFNTANGKLVYTKKYDPGSSTIDVSVDTLTPDTKYRLALSAGYIVNEKPYTKEFINKFFVTDSMGISIEKDFVTDNSVSLKIELQDYSKVVSASVGIFDAKGDRIETIPIINVDFTNPITLFEGLKSNTTYQVRFSNIVTDQGTITDYGDLQKYTTLKKLAQITQKPTFLLNKKNSSFKVQVQGVVDSDKGIEKYRYELFELGADVNKATPIKTITSTNTDAVSFFIDDVTIIRGTNYIARVVAQFYDNEKYVDIASSVTDAYYMDGTGFPIATFEGKSTFESIQGFIKLDPNKAKVQKDSLKISYHNSIGDVSSYLFNFNDIKTNGDTLIIPFNVNGLRKNDTYIVSVYGKVDLDDGMNYNEKLLGNLIILTNETNSMRASLTSIKSSNNIFEIAVSLKEDDAKFPCNLEASTLNNLTFNLYAGTQANGDLVESLSIKDLDTADYVSTVGGEYYNKTVTLTEASFKLAPSRLTSSAYTIEVTQAYDYTKYKNKIDITNNTLTFTRNASPPELPADVKDALDIKLIQNAVAKNYGGEINDKLADTTVVGFTAKAKYDNFNKLAKQFTYRIYDAVEYDDAINKGQKPTQLDSISVDVNPLGDLVPAITVFFGASTDDPSKNIFYDRANCVRGRKYYITYEAKLDITGEGNANYNYPQDYKPGTVLQSVLLDAPKQEPQFEFYPHTTAADGSATWKYRAKDVDLTLGNSIKHFNVYVNNSIKSSTTYTINDKFEFQEVKFTGLSNNTNYVVKAKCSLYVYNNIMDVELINTFFEGVSTLSDKISYTYTNDPTNYRIIVDLSSSVAADIKKLSALNVIAQHQSGTKMTFIVPVDYFDSSPNNAIAYIPYTNLSSGMGQWKISIQAIYDKGASGFYIHSDKGYLAIQKMQNNNTGKYQIVKTSINGLTDSEYATNSLFTKFQFNPKDATINFEQPIQNYASTLNLTFDKKGARVKDTYDYITLKQLEYSDLKTNGLDNFSVNLDKIVPVVNLFNDSLVPPGLDISATLTDVNINMHLEGHNVVDGNKIYIQLYKHDGTTYRQVKDYPVNVKADMSDYSINIPDLEPKTDYMFKLYTYIGGGDPLYLYDSYYQKIGVPYKFSTLQRINISDVKLTYVPTNFLQKKLNLEYSVDIVTGFNMRYYLSKLNVKTGSYELFKNYDDLCSLSSDLSQQVFQTQNAKTISCNPGQGILLGQKYRMELIAVSKTKDDVRLGSAFCDLDLSNIQDPTFGVISTPSLTNDEHSLEFKVKPIDIYKIIKGDFNSTKCGEYMVRMFDNLGKDITPMQYKDKFYSVASSQNFILDGAEIKGGSKYYIAFYAFLDKNNDNADDLLSSYTNIASVPQNLLSKYQVYKVSGSTLSDYNVSFGTINCVQNPNDNSKIRLEFYNAVNLSNVKEIQYTIYNDAGYSDSKTEKFSPNIQNPGESSAYYYYDLNATLEEKGTYYVVIQFKSDTGNIGEPILKTYNYSAKGSTSGSIFFRALSFIKFLKRC